MPPKAKLQAPIDRPLSRAYLRQFLGWSTAYPPGMSQPNSLRRMENVMVNRDASVRVRPGLRYLSKNSTGNGLNAAFPGAKLVGSHETFFTNDGVKAYLFAYRQADNTISFLAAVAQESDTIPYIVRALNHASVGFPSLPPTFSAGTTYVKYLQIDNKIIALSNNGELPIIFYVGSSKGTKRVNSITVPSFEEYDSLLFAGHLDLDTRGNPNATTWTYAEPSQTSLQNDAADGLDPAGTAIAQYNVAYFYTFSNEFGESSASTVQQLKLKRPPSAWLWKNRKANANPAIMEPGPLDVQSPNSAIDQIHLRVPQGSYETAQAQGATKINFYYLAWSDQEPVPVEAQLLAEKTITPTSLWNQAWVRHTPQAYAISRTHPFPTLNNRYNYSDPTTAMNGLVAADKLITVGDPNKAAVIKWTSSRVGEYLNFGSNMGGGYKTLTSGNLYVPVAVKLWQNPQSADTLTILCQGVDGMSTAYYMAPIQIASQSDATNAFGFEETTATPGTVSPFGCEVSNNSLFHPMEDALIKSTASNYNINHKNMTDLIQKDWKGLTKKNHIVSAVHDARIYYLVYNPAGAALESGCWGNEVWVLDTAAKDTGTWSRWLVQGHSLRKLEVNGKLLMSITRPEGHYAFDEDKVEDDYVTGANSVSQRPIPWYFETNTQGANRAHDAWAHLQQLTLTLGNFKGQVEWGIRGFDVHGRQIERKKITRNDAAVPADGLPWDVDDHLAVRRDMKEWRFFASSVGSLHSEGQISLVMYRYVPVTVNVGYEYGSVETFEYGSGGILSNAHTDGVPVPMIDRAQP